MTRFHLAAVAALSCLAAPAAAQPPAAVESFTPGRGQSAGQESMYFPANVLGYPDTTARRSVPAIMPEQIASLGLGGEIILRFDHAIIDADGPDFTVFENAFYYTIGPRERLYAEPAVVSVSRDGATYVSFPFDSLSLAGFAGTAPTFGDSDPMNPLVSGGNSFDLSLVGIDSVRFVRIVDATSIVLDDPTHPMWDATLTGFDLDAVIAIPTIGRGPSRASLEAPRPLLQVSPNPAASFIRIQADAVSRVRCIDRLGRVAIDRGYETPVDHSVIDISSLSAGTYVVEVVDSACARTTLLQIVR